MKRPDRPVSSLKDGIIPLPDEIIRDCQEFKRRFQEGEKFNPSLPIISNLSGSQGKRYTARSYFKTDHHKGNSPFFIVIIEDIERTEIVKEQSAILKYRLSARELEICRSVKEGLTSKEIADRFFVSQCTVDTHIDLTSVIN
jgi:hypothetical protein